MLPFAVASITLALVFYSIGVWSERAQRVLKPWHAVVFWMGLLFDTGGTTLMSQLAQGQFQFNFHQLTGALAIALMLFHAVWATVVLARGSEGSKARFHRFSVVVWFIWLVPYLSGMVLAMAR